MVSNAIIMHSMNIHILQRLYEHHTLLRFLRPTESFQLSGQNSSTPVCVCSDSVQIQFEFVIQVLLYRENSIRKIVG